MVEVFKTNVVEWHHATMLVAEIQKAFDGYQANFDLQDCDNILRIKTAAALIPPIPVILLLKHFGFHAEVLPDEATDSISKLLQPSFSGT